MYGNMMVALDNSVCSNWAMELALDLARRMGAKLTGNHVYAARLHDVRFHQLEPGLPDQYQSEQVLQHWRDVHADLIGRGLKIISESYLDLFEEKCQAAGVKAVRKTAEGRNYEELVKDVCESRYDLIALGAQGLGRVGRSVVGSVCERVVRLVECDTLVVRNRRSPVDGKLLVAIDGSSYSFAALCAALDLNRAYGSPVQAVAVYDPFFHSVAFKSLTGVLSESAAKLFRFIEQEKLHGEVIDNGLKRVYQSHLVQAQKIAEQRDVPLEIEVLEGKPFDAIASYVEKTNPSLLLVGRVGIHRGEGMTLGSTAENLVRLANCNMLVANQRAKAACAGASPAACE